MYWSGKAHQKSNVNKKSKFLGKSEILWHKIYYLIYFILLRGPFASNSVLEDKIEAKE